MSKSLNIMFIFIWI